jgi:hypothetical protein
VRLNVELRNLQTLNRDGPGTVARGVIRELQNLQTLNRDGPGTVARGVIRVTRGQTNKMLSSSWIKQVRLLPDTTKLHTMCDNHVLLKSCFDESTRMGIINCKLYDPLHQMLIPSDNCPVSLTYADGMHKLLQLLELCPSSVAAVHNMYPQWMLHSPAGRAAQTVTGRSCF